jgi:GNAT superfamily N-acetyltransferase
MGEVSVRPATVDDLEQIRALYAEGIEWHAEQWPEDYRSFTVDWSLEDQLSACAEDGSQCLLVAEVGRRLVGFVSGFLQPTPAEGMLRYNGPVVGIGDVVVTASFRGHGVGTQLMHELERWARGRDAATISLNVDDRNTAARALYLREGFHSVNLQMRKDLRP